MLPHFCCTNMTGMEEYQYYQASCSFDFNKGSYISYTATCMYGCFSQTELFSGSSKECQRLPFYPVYDTVHLTQGNTVYGAPHPKPDVDKLYVGRRWLVKDLVRQGENQLNRYMANSEESVMRAVVEIVKKQGKRGDGELVSK